VKYFWLALLCAGLLGGAESLALGLLRPGPPPGTADAHDNHILDFSCAGYRSGGVKLPDVPAAARIGPASGDSTSRIQTAIDALP